MAFRELVSGDCSGSSSTTKFASHAAQDRSLHREAPQLSRPGPSRARPDDQFVKEFFSQHPQAMGGPLNMKQLGSELDNIHLQEMRRGPQGSWADEFHASPQFHGPLPHEMEREFERIYQQSHQQMHPPPGAWEQDFLKNQAQYQPQINPQEQQYFERLYQSIPQQQAKITELDWKDEFLEQTEGKGKQKSWEEEFESNPEWQELWKQSMEQRNALEPGEEEEIWNNAAMNPFGQHRVDVQTYEFEANNPFLTHPNPFEEGMRLMDSGNLSDAALAFEAAVQKEPKDAEAWFRLGSVQQENEKEAPAISALTEAVALSPQHIGATLGLAVSFTNEGAEAQALEALENWVRTKYPHLNFAQHREGSRHDYVTGLYIQAVKSSEQIDPDVQVGLGVLFNISCEYDKAVDCFETVVRLKPDDYLVWNRLGATLANGGRSEEAINAYYKALELKPSFVRARYNLGVSCINIGCYKEAAEHFLGALTLHGNQDSSRNTSKNLWDTLRRTFLMMSRRDLSDMTNSCNVDVFRSEFDF